MKTIKTFQAIEMNGEKYTCLDRYKFDFELCKPSKGWCQIDTRNNAPYYGSWCNLSTLEKISYTEGDITHTIFNSKEDMIQQLKLGWKGWGEKIDPMNEGNEKILRENKLEHLMFYLKEPISIFEWKEIGDFSKCIEARHDNGVFVVEVEKEIYDDMLEVLPPINYLKEKDIPESIKEKIKKETGEELKIIGMFSVGEAQNIVKGKLVYSTFVEAIAIGKYEPNSYYNIGYMEKFI